MFHHLDNGDTKPIGKIPQGFQKNFLNLNEKMHFNVTVEEQEEFQNSFFDQDILVFLSSHTGNPLSGTPECDT